MVESAILISGLTYAAWNLVLCSQGCDHGNYYKGKRTITQNNSWIINCCTWEEEVNIEPGFCTLVVCIECFICPCYYIGFLCADPFCEIAACHFEKKKHITKLQSPEVQMMEEKKLCKK